MEPIEATEKKSLREAMPITSGFIDAMRDAFGRDEVNSWILGQNGGAFWASENGHEWGERPALGAQAMSLYAYERLGQPRLQTRKPMARTKEDVDG